MSQIVVGTSGWSYPEWKHTLYEGIPQRGWLTRYSEVFNAVEVNNTYRRDLTPETAAAWKADTPDDFRFVIKAHQRATHFNRLKSPVEDAASQATQARLLGGRLGLIYFQMPHNFVRDDALLEGFLNAWPSDLPAVWEFTHMSWHDATVHDLLKAHGVGWVISDAKLEHPPFVATAPDGYVRIRQDAYDAAALERSVAAIRDLETERSWVFIRHGRDAPDLAAAVNDSLVS